MEMDALCSRILFRYTIFFLCKIKLQKNILSLKQTFRIDL